MTDPELAHLLALDREATPEPWYARNRFISRVPDNSGVGATLPTNHISNVVDRADAQLIAAYRTAVPKLVAEIRRSREERDAHSEICVEYNDYLRTRAEAAEAALKKIAQLPPGCTSSAHFAIETATVALCKGTIPNTFVVCGEGGNFCSVACERKGK